jgi:hypothetical protein
VKKAAKMQILAALMIVGAGWWLAGCKSAPSLTQAQALSMIQAKYDQTPGTPFQIAINDRGMQQGVTAKYWAGTKRYPNGYWGDFALTPEGKKLVKLTAGGDVIQWRPDSPKDPKFAIALTTLATCGLKPDHPGEPQKSGDNMTVKFMEQVDMSKLPAPLQEIAHNPGNKFTVQRTATFTQSGGAWTLQTIE